MTKIKRPQSAHTLHTSANVLNRRLHAHASTNQKHISAGEIIVRIATNLLIQQQNLIGCHCHCEFVGRLAAAVRGGGV